MIPTWASFLAFLFHGLLRSQTSQGSSSSSTPSASASPLSSRGITSHKPSSTACASPSFLRRAHWDRTLDFAFRDASPYNSVVMGSPDLARTGTAKQERQNATMRHKIGRTRRLAYCFSKRFENHVASVALGYVWYNVGWIVKGLRMTPAMAVGATDHLWTIEEFHDAITEAAKEPVSKPEKRAAGAPDARMDLPRVAERAGLPARAPRRRRGPRDACGAPAHRPGRCARCGGTRAALRRERPRGPLLLDRSEA